DVRRDLGLMKNTVATLEARPPPKVEPESIDVLFLAMHSGHLEMGRYLGAFENIFASKELLALYPNHRLGMAYVFGSADTANSIYAIEAKDRKEGDKLFGRLGTPPSKDSTDRLADLGPKVWSLFPGIADSKSARKEQRCL